MEEAQMGALDAAAFRRVWRRVMPEDRPDCPFTLDAEPERTLPAVPAPLPCPAPAGPAVCLGEASGDEMPGLERLLAGTAECYGIYRGLARRWRRERLLSDLAEEKLRQVKRLKAAGYLICGRELFRPLPPVPEGGPLASHLRARFQAEQWLALEFFTGAGTAADPCLADLYRQLGRECREHAAWIRGWMERR